LLSRTLDFSMFTNNTDAPQELHKQNTGYFNGKSCNTDRGVIAYLAVAGKGGMQLVAAFRFYLAAASRPHAVDFCRTRACGLVGGAEDAPAGTAAAAGRLCCFRFGAAAGATGTFTKADVAGQGNEGLHQSGPRDSLRGWWRFVGVHHRRQRTRG
jgi:hypothetical protein